ARRARDLSRAAGRRVLRRRLPRRADQGVGARRAGVDPGRSGARDGGGAVAARAERRGVSIRRAGPDDVDFLVELYADPDVRPFLAGGHDFGPESVAAEVERSELDPDASGLFLIEVDGERAGAMSF